MDDNKDISRRRFVGLLGAGYAAPLLQPTTANAAQEDPSVKQALDSVTDPNVARLITHLLGRIEQLETQVRNSLPSGTANAHSINSSTINNTTNNGEPVHTFQQFGPANQYPVPLNTSIQWRRRENEPSSGTSQILSLVHENYKSDAFPWTLSTVLRTEHTKGEAAGNFVRLLNYGGGNDCWGTGYHVEAYNRNGGTTIGNNIEMHRQNGNGRVIGLNVLGVDWDHDDIGTKLPPKPTQLSEAINIQGSKKSTWNTGLHFDTNSKGTQAMLIEGDWNKAINIQSRLIDREENKRWLWNTGLHFDKDSQGTRAILIEGDWNVGLDMGENNIRMEAGSKIFLEGTSMISILWNAEKARIEFRFGDKVLGYLSHDSPEHAL